MTLDQKGFAYFLGSGEDADHWFNETVRPAINNALNGATT